MMIFAVHDREVVTYYDAEDGDMALGFHLELTPDASLEALRVRKLGGEPFDVPVPPPLCQPWAMRPAPVRFDPPRHCLGSESWVEAPARCAICRRRFYGTGGYVPPHYAARVLLGLPHEVAADLAARMGEVLP
jgi:hypothetical protein